jgi:plasmid stability protein
MAQLLVRNIDPETIDCLKNRAKLHHRSLQGEIKFILEEVAHTSNANSSSWPLGFLEDILGGWQG